ncbi:hypothetical protein SAMN06265360_101154 [Haloechinothrix alba]|uniref:Uncharacterized protein n=1 Tax=Haloechinothrix alba TaxID=664784 RepID=A0A238V1B9_9PSEU|nr:hypothetical protein SAMN06265360_101154 [Haloechinothrix alba]
MPAADPLCRPGCTVAAVARRAGYGTASALTAAVECERGISRPASIVRRPGALMGPGSPSVARLTGHSRDA